MDSYFLQSTRSLVSWFSWSLDGNISLCINRKKEKREVIGHLVTKVKSSLSFRTHEYKDASLLAICCFRSIKVKLKLKLKIGKLIGNLVFTMSLVIWF